MYFRQALLKLVPRHATLLDLCQERAKDEVKTARSRGMSIRELSARRLGGQTYQSAESIEGGEESAISGRQRSGHRSSLNAVTSRGSLAFWEGQEMDEEKGSRPPSRTESGLKAVEKCRSKPGSVWLHFPYIELLFLLVAFEGAVAAQAATLRDAACPVVFVSALIALVRNYRLPRVAVRELLV